MRCLGARLVITAPGKAYEGTYWQKIDTTIRSDILKFSPGTNVCLRDSTSCIIWCRVWVVKSI